METEKNMQAIAQYLAKLPDRSPKQIGQALMLPEGKVSWALRRLEKAKLVVRSAPGVYRLAHPAPQPSPPDVVYLETYADLQARVLAAEARADGLREKLDEERAENKRQAKELRDAGESFEQVWGLRCKLAKRRKRLQARLSFVETLIAELDNIKDPTVPF